VAVGSTHLVVIGAGAGGLATAVAASEMGVEVTLVEEGILGGGKLNYSCVPSKAVLQYVHAAEQVEILFPLCNRRFYYSLKDSTMLQRGRRW